MRERHAAMVANHAAAGICHTAGGKPCHAGRKARAPHRTSTRRRQNSPYERPTRAHAAASRLMLDQQNLPHGISISGSIVSLIIAGVLGSIGSVLLRTTAGTPSALAYAFMGASIAMDAFVITTLRRDINRYWRHAGNGLEQNACLDKGEILVVAVGILIWVAHIAVAGAGNE